MGAKTVQIERRRKGQTLVFRQHSKAGKKNPISTSTAPWCTPRGEGYLGPQDPSLTGNTGEEGGSSPTDA